MIHRLIQAVFFANFLFNTAYAEVPVVDESENYALLDEQTVPDQPLAREQNSSDSQVALAHDNTTSTSQNVDLLNKIQGLQQEIQELRGQLEIQTHELKLLQEQQLSFYKDLDARMQGNLNTASNTSSPSNVNLDTLANESIHPISEIKRGNPADEQISYLAAYELVKNKQYEEALPAMQTFIRHYPQGGYTANAEYWLGELYMVRKNFPQAMEHFEIVLQKYPSSSKCSASLLKIGYALAALGKKQEAKERLKDIVKKYPDTITAQLAANKLHTLGA